MVSYVIGDVHGCLKALRALLEKVRYNPKKDKLYFIGDLVGRGPDDWGVLSLVRKLGAQVIIGNHDLHFLATHGCIEAQRNLSEDQMQDFAYYYQAKFSYYDNATDTLLVHAGIWPGWNLKEVAEKAAELERTVLNKKAVAMLAQVLYGNDEIAWSESLRGWERWRCLINIFTRMRVIDEKHQMDLDFSGEKHEIPSGKKPWYSSGKPPCQKIVFGHWSRHGAKTDYANYDCIDGGCVWGGQLIAIELGSNVRHKL
ncbi:MAG: symmetrical bis(5'-nucleosyl)-tetraphosphatase [Pseudomonadota bacterium]|nr:symmetrical bis(5'-nucleosyl)-tetraphosphatase [Pseudomonadota bacterium]